jgi:tripartite-type tricarboxylate transporter receptor subunit TctC
MKNRRDIVMKLARRKFLHLATGAAAPLVMPRAASALDYPTRPIHILVGFAAGGASDIVARLLAQQLSERLGQSVVVENRTGAGTNIATEAAVRSTPDGYTLLLATHSNAINATLYASLRFDFMRDIAPVASIGRVATVMLVNPSFPAKTVGEFIAYAKANPGKINFASAGVGSLTHVAGALFDMMAGVQSVHVPYRGEAPGVIGLLAGEVQLMFPTLSVSLPHIKSGTLRPLAVTTSTPLDVLPDIPTVAQFLPGFEVSAWQGIGAPRDTPAEIVDKLNRAINAALADSDMQRRLAEVAYEPVSMTPAAFGKFIAEETDKWGGVVRAANIKPV